MSVCMALLCPFCPIDFSLLCGAGLSWYQQQLTIKYTGRTKPVFESVNSNILFAAFPENKITSQVLLFKGAID